MSIPKLTQSTIEEWKRDFCPVCDLRGEECSQTDKEIEKCIFYSHWLENQWEHYKEWEEEEIYQQKEEGLIPPGEV